ncbi:phosphopantetheine-binding protein [Streptomyces silvisoli]|uniref:Phosphopantetheine-binding protein n=1 Tax=Streptomyces silvisoli TaxID=3034235 RepID=A0ABT5ZL16_9ACTN|nr:phosphopantetheine-binding protein [Streptomyces silvisoli]MDF3290289.1 phosphopantetheine-binding protein [Streptomyces silvisoli]
MTTLLQRFESAFRPRCRRLDPTEPLDLDASLVSLGVDSMEVVELIIALEDEFAIQLPQSLLTPETFATPSTILKALGSLVSA